MYAAILDDATGKFIVVEVDSDAFRESERENDPLFVGEKTVCLLEADFAEYVTYCSTSDGIPMRVVSPHTGLAFAVS